MRAKPGTETHCAEKFDTSKSRPISSSGQNQLIHELENEGNKTYITKISEILSHFYKI